MLPELLMLTKNKQNGMAVKSRYIGYEEKAKKENKNKKVSRAESLDFTDCTGFYHMECSCGMYIQYVYWFFLSSDVKCDIL